MIKHLLEIDSVQLHFGDRVILSDIYLRCETGKITALIGRNGSGKSCLMKFAFGMQRTSQGMVRVDGKWINPGRVSSFISYLPQFSFIPGNLRIRQVFRDFMLSTSDLDEYFPELVRHDEAKVATLSGGLRRILEVCAILCSPTPFSFLDEPFTHIMPLYVAQLRDLMLRVKERKGLLIADHRHEDVRPVTDQLYLLDDGFLRTASNWTLRRERDGQ